MTPVPRPICLHARSELVMDLRDFARRLAADPLSASVTIEIPGPGMEDDRTQILVRVGRTGVRLPTYRGWVLDDASPMAIHRILTDLVEHATPTVKSTGVHDDAIRRHVRAAMLVAQHDRTLPDDVVETDGVVTTEACLDPDGRLTLWVPIPTGHHQVSIDHDELEAVMGPMPIPCHLHQAADPASAEAWIVVVGPSMNDQEGLLIDVGNEDPIESMRIARDLTEYRQAA